MTIRKLIITIFFVILLPVTAYLLWPKPSLSDQLQNLEDDGFSGAVLIAKGDEVIHAKGYGYASCDQSVENSAETIFAIGSITKMFTAAAIGQLDAAGKLNIDDTVATYLDGVPEDKTAITIRQLLDHTSGLQTYHERTDQGDFEAMTAYQAGQIILQRPLEFEPGKDENYSNSGYTLLALIIEQVSAESYTDYMRQNIFQPIGMNSTGFWGDDLTPMATTQTMGCDSPNYWDYSYVLVGNGGMVSTVSDLMLWVQALKRETVLSQSAKARIGFDTLLADGFGEAGGSDQHEFNADIEYSGQSEVLVVAISNLNIVLAEDIGVDLLSAADRE